MQSKLLNAAYKKYAVYIESNISKHSFISNMKYVCWNLSKVQLCKFASQLFILPYVRIFLIVTHQMQCSLTTLHAQWFYRCAAIQLNSNDEWVLLSDRSFTIFNNVIGLNSFPSFVCFRIKTCVSNYQKQVCDYDRPTVNWDCYTWKAFCHEMCDKARSMCVDKMSCETW